MIEKIPETIKIYQKIYQIKKFFFDSIVSIISIPSLNSTKASHMPPG
jgi:hypothetical protein